MVALSEWNTFDGIISMMDQCKCTVNLHAHDSIHATKLPCLSGGQFNLRRVPVVAVDDWLDEKGTTQPYVYEKSWDSAVDEPVFICHTSGTTGKLLPTTVHHHCSCPPSSRI